MFKSARIKLTVWYLLIIMMVSLTFSIVIFGMVSREVDRFEMMQRTRVERRLRDDILLPPGSVPFRRFIEEHGMANPELVQETKERILYVLFLANGSIFILAGWFGYILAGRTLQPIKRMVDHQNRFVSDASHELKTPLASLKIAFEVYLRDHKRTLKDADIIIQESVDEVQKLQTLSESLLEIAENEEGSEKFMMEKLNIESVINEAMKKIRNLAHKKNVEFKINVPKFSLRGNKKSLVSLFTILFDNAIKYSHEGSLVDVTAKVIDSKLSVIVKDSGIGISTQDLPRVFDRFYRADSARSKSDTGGNGLGLSIARQIALKHGGSLFVESVLGKGSTFVFEFPLTNHS